MLWVTLTITHNIGKYCLVGGVFQSYRSKYFMKGTDDEVSFGDTIEIDLNKEMGDGGNCHRHIDCMFIKDIVPLLLEEGIIEEREVAGEEKDDRNEECYCPMMCNLISTVEDLVVRMKRLEDIIAQQNSLIMSLKPRTTPNPAANARKQA